MEKKKYQAPTVRVFGKVAELTEDFQFIKCSGSADTFQPSPPMTFGSGDPTYMCSSGGGD